MRLTPWLTWSLILFSTGFLVWKCQFGVDLTDESFYALPAWKLFSLGDEPFKDEIYNAPRQNDWLNQNTVAHLVPFSLLPIRRSAVLFYAFCLLTALTVLFRRRIGLFGGLFFAGAILFDINFMPTWSYNWWLRNGLLLHFAFLITGFDRGKRALFYAAGFTLGVVWLAYNSVVPFQLAVAVPFIWWGCRHHRREFVAYALGIATPLLAFGLDFFWHGRWEAFRYALSAMSSLDYYNKSFSLGKVFSLLSFLGDFPFFWLFGAFVVTATFFKRLHPAICFLFGIFLVRKCYYPHSHQTVLNAFLSVAIWGFFYVGCHRTRKEERYLLALASVTLFSVGLSSVARMWAMAWAAPVLILAFVLAYEKSKAELFSRLVLGMALLFIAKDSFLLQKNVFSTFYDVPIAQAIKVLTVPPLAGLKTSARRAYLVEKLASILAPKKFALAFGGTPGAFLFGSVRSGIDTVFTDVEAPPKLIRQSLRRMLARDRLPEVFVISKMHPWTWGMINSPNPPSAKTPYAEVIRENDFTRFAHCAQKSPLLLEPEIEVWSADEKKLRPCLDDISYRLRLATVISD